MQVRRTITTVEYPSDSSETEHWELVPQCNVYEPNELLTEGGISIKTNDDLQWVVRHGGRAVRSIPSPEFRADIKNTGRSEIVTLTSSCEIRYDGHFVTDKQPRRENKA